MNHTLKELGLDATSIGDEGAKAIAEALRVNHTLVELNLHNNGNIGDAAKEALWEAVKGRDGFELNL